MHRCPNRACPSRGLETLINWVGIADIEGVGEQSIRLLWERGLAPLAPGPLSPDERAAARARGIRRNLRLSGGRSDHGVEAGHRSRASCSASTSRRSAGCSRGTSPPIRRCRPAGRRRRRRSSRRRRASAPTAPSSSPSGSQMPRTVGSSRSFVALGLRFEAGEEARPVEGPLSGQTYVITGTLEKYSRDEATTALEEPWGESDGLRLDEDDRSRRRRGARRLEAHEGSARAACRCSPKLTSRLCSVQGDRHRLPLPLRRLCRRRHPDVDPSAP